LLLSSLSFSVALLPPPEKFVAVPGGMMPARCVYEVPSGTHIIHNENHQGVEFHHPDGTVRQVGPCEIPLPLPEVPAPTPPDGWQVYTYWVGPNDITSFTGFWNVPNTPAKTEGQILYLFTGLQNNCGGYGLCPDNTTGRLSATTNILQPVLQFGITPAGGGSFWGIASWYVADFGTAHTTVSKVAPGDMLFGLMNKTAAPNTWTIYFNDTTNPNVEPTVLNVSNALTTSEPDAYVTLEVYQVSTCSQYPTQGVKFTKMVIEKDDGKPVIPKWDTNTYSSACSEKVTIVSPSEVDIAW